MLACVARTEHRSLWAVAREPYARTLAAYGAYEDVERMERAVAEFRAIADAVRTNHAFAAPEQLERAHRDLLSRYGVPVSLSYEEAVNAATVLFRTLKTVRPDEVS